MVSERAAVKSQGLPAGSNAMVLVLVLVLEEMAVAWWWL